MAKVLSSISGNLISAASAGYAPTNSADVSAIASAYQVVSATATQLYAGTAFLTGVNGAPVSASRAGNAANASLATSAYYDGTGRLISALPDSAAVSSIASSYAESAASSKADSSSLSYYALSSDVSGVIDTVSANSASWSGGGTVSVDSNMSGDGYNTPLGLSPVVKLSASGSAGYVYIHGGSGSFTVSGNTARFQGTGKNNMNVSFNCDPDKKAALFIGPWVASNNWAGVSAQYTAGNINMNIRASGSGSAGLTLWDSAGSAQMQKSSIPYWDGKLDSSASSSFYTTANESGYVGSSYVDSAVSGKMDSSALSSYALSSDVSGVIDTVSSNSASWSGGSLPISGSAGDESGIYDANYVEFTRYDTAGEPDIRTARLTPDYFSIDYTLDGNDYTSMMLSDSMLSFTLPDGTRSVDAYSIDTWNSAVDTVANNSATWGQGGVDSATVSAIASGYAESAASSKLDTTAFNSGDFYTTANESGYVGSAYVDSAVSGKMDTSAMTSYALSADVSGTVDLVSTQSANWGGSALALSAGPGVKLEKVGDTLVASTDETVLWSGSIGDEGDTASLSESIENFSHVSVYAVPVYGGADAVVTKFETRTGLNSCKFGTWSQDGGSTYLANYNLNVSGNSAGLIRSKQIIINHSNGAVSVAQNSATGTYMAPITKIVGINRTAGV